MRFFAQAILLLALATSSLWAASTVDLTVELPKEKVYLGRSFEVAVTISWPGEATDWVVKSIEGPALTGLRELSHSLSSRVEAGEKGTRSLQIHRFAFVAEKEGQAELGAIELRVLAQGGEERVLSTKALRMTVTASWLDSTLASPKKMAIIAIALCLFIFLSALIRWRGQRKAAAERRTAEAEEADRARATRITAPLEKIKDLLADDECKELYATAKELILLLIKERGAKLENNEKETLLAALEEIEITVGQKKGLQKVLEDAHLVRFAGLRPEREEREQVYSRIREFASPFTRVNEDVD